MMCRALLALVVALTLPVSAQAKIPSAKMPDLEVDDDIDVTSGAVTGLRCAVEAHLSGKLELLQTCPPEESVHGIVIYDVTEGAIIRLVPGRVAQYQLEMAYGGGSLDVSGTVQGIDSETGIVTIEVEEFSVTKKPKAGGFKGCL